MGRTVPMGTMQRLTLGGHSYILKGSPEPTEQVPRLSRLDQQRDKLLADLKHANAKIAEGKMSKGHRARIVRKLQEVDTLRKMHVGPKIKVALDGKMPWEESWRRDGWNLSIFNSTSEATPPMAFYVSQKSSKDKVVVEHIVPPWMPKGAKKDAKFRIVTRYENEQVGTAFAADSKTALTAVDAAMKSIRQMRARKMGTGKKLTVVVNKQLFEFDAVKLKKIKEKLDQWKQYVIRVGKEKYVIRRGQKPSVEDVDPDIGSDTPVEIKSLNAWMRLVSTQGD